MIGDTGSIDAAALSWRISVLVDMGDCKRSPV